jgi:hypothetical protein
MPFFQYQNSIKELQYAILGTFYRLNHECFDLTAVTPYLKQNCVVGFEFGVADGFNFNFLNQEELTRCLKIVDENELPNLDFFFIVRYHIVKDNGKKVPLKFDYHLLRLVFQESGMEIQICHEKGTQRVPMDDLTYFLIERINVGLSQKKLMPLFRGISEKSE